jgi:crossover junction endodeoxyribonuclease RuvC
MRILGIDPGLRVTGFGVIEFTGQRLKYIASGMVSTDSATQSIPERLGLIFQGICEVIDTYQPEYAAIEQVFLNINPKSTLVLGQARGAAITALVSKNLDVVEFSALEVKKNVVGSGRAAKSQVQEMIKRLLSLSKAPGTDAADALAVAICAAHQYRMKQQLAKISTSVKNRKVNK